MPTRFLSIISSFSVSALLTLCPYRAWAEDDPIAKYLKQKGFSNVPYADQLRVAPGGYVAYDERYPDAPALFYGPVDGEVVTLIKEPKNIVVPGSTVDRVRGLNLETKLFGTSLALKFKFPESVHYGDLTLEPTGGPDPNTFYRLLSPGEPLEKELLEYGDGHGVSVYTNQHLYLIETVYYALGIDITSSKGFEVAAGSASIPDCTLPSQAPTPSGGGNVAGQSSTTPTIQHETTQNTTGTSKEQSLRNMGEAALAAGLVAAGQSAGTQAGAKVSGSGGVAAAKKAADATAGAALKAASGSIALSGGGYCQVNRTTVHFTPPTPVPLAAQLLAVVPSSGSQAWNLVGAVVTFDGGKTKEQPKKLNRSDFPAQQGPQPSQPEQQSRRQKRQSEQQQH